MYVAKKTFLDNRLRKLNVALNDLAKENFEI